MTTAACDKRYERLIDKILLGEDAQQWESLRTHLRGCEPCRQRYNRVTLAERMLHGGPERVVGPSPLEIDRIAGALSPVEKTAWERLLVWLSPTPRWASGVALAAAALVLIPFMIRTPMNAQPSVPVPPAGPSGPVEL